MGFLDSFLKIKQDKVQATIKAARDKGYNAYVVINGEMHLIVD